MSKRKPHPFDAAIVRALKMEPGIAEDATYEGQKKAAHEFRLRYGNRYAGCYIDGYIRNDSAQGAIYRPRLRAVNAV